ncbi:MAG: 2-C-methyl-D-erythritol 4-phosphate cytidylyltransferase [Ginsengibacter sp.]
MNKVALIVAGGKGARMNSDLPKQFMTIYNRPMLYYTIKAFIAAYEDLEIILVLPVEHMAMGQEIIDGYFDQSRFKLCEGGRTRFHSVQNGLSLVQQESIIFVHDGVRCFLAKDLIERCYLAAIENGTAVPAVESKDSLRLVTRDGNKIINRQKVRMIQTPQTFHSKILLPAFNIDYKEEFTDEASVVEAYGIKINIVEGDERNIKITTPYDFKIAESLLLE